MYKAQKNLGISRGYVGLVLFFMLISGVQAKASVDDLRDAIYKIKCHVLSISNLSATEITRQTAIINNNIANIGDNDEIIKYAFQLVEAYEKSSFGPLFINSTTKNGFSRSNTSGKEIHHALFAVQQGLIDYAFTPKNLKSYSDFFEGAGFKTADYFPGSVDAPENPEKLYEEKINASQPKTWGSPVSGESGDARRPTGCYLAPGSVATVIVPQSMVNKGYSVRVGAHSWDLVKKTTIKRLDRVSLIYPITSTETLVANPLGGGIYIDVPYLANAGVVSVQFQNVVRSPFFSARSFDKTTLEEWQDTERSNPGPWADFESDKFMMQVPASWIYKLEDPVTLMKDWDIAMDAISELFGLPLVRPKTVLYTQIDVIMRGNANYPGYPQSNYPYKPTDVENGYKNHWMVRGPQHVDWTVFHEVGHSQKFTKFYGEIESTVNLPYVAIQNGKFGMDLDLAYGNSIADWSQISLDQGAIMWMVTENFRNGKPMSKTNKPGDEVKYQHRGHGKYVEIAKLFGWEALCNFWHEVNVDYMEGGKDYPANYNADPNDSRILRMSRAAGVDLRPLIHFWGVQPDNPASLKSAIESENLKPSALIYDELQHYKTIIPMNNEEFNVHTKVLYPNGPKTGKNPLYGDGWYETWMSKYNETHGEAAVAALQDIIDLYFPDGRPELSTNSIEIDEYKAPLFYPNPLTDKVIFKSETEIENIQIFDLSGREVMFDFLRNNDSYVVNLGGKEPGIYVVNLVTSGKSKSFQIVKR